MIPIVLSAWGLLFGGMAADASGWTQGSMSLAMKVIAIIFIVLSGIALAMHITVIFFNRPKFIVPPPHRNEPGAFAQRSAMQDRDQAGPGV